MGEREREMFYLTTHSTHFIYGYMASDIWLRTILIVRKETRCHHIGYSYRLTARVLLYAPSHRQDNTYHSLLHQSWSTGWNEKYFNGSTPWRIDPTTHRTMIKHSTYELRPTPHPRMGAMLSEVVWHQHRNLSDKNKSLQYNQTIKIHNNWNELKRKGIY